MRGVARVIARDHAKQRKDNPRLAALTELDYLLAVDDFSRIRALLHVLHEKQVDLVTSAAVVVQIWRDGRRQARLAQFLSGVHVRSLGPGEDRLTGEVLAAAGKKDIADAHLRLCVSDGDQVFTSDRHDLFHLLATRGVDARIIAICAWGTRPVRVAAPNRRSNLSFVSIHD